MFVLVRAVTYATLFIAFVLVYLPARFLSWSGIVEPATTGAPQVAGMIMVAIGTAIALWCVVTFVFIGKGTPAPFDPPRKLVIRGPYQFVRNPMYIGAAMTLAGAALFYESLSIFIYSGVFFLITICSLCCTRSRLCGELSVMNTKRTSAASAVGCRGQVRSRK
jgi:protein-S-isoprenylcysteine O-methyltransferase Ste14